MQVILLQDVKSLGKKGDIVKVSDGYARNYVLPKKLGVEANDKNKNELKLQKAHEDKIAAQKLAQAQELAASLEQIKITVKMREERAAKCSVPSVPRKSQPPPRSSTAWISTRRRSSSRIPSSPSECLKCRSSFTHR